jgi:predicted AlkP superfamily pyrophosphatase or phosphodiesterase
MGGGGISSYLHPMNPIISILLALLLLQACSTTEPTQRPVILISFDGFRPDYVEKYNTPHLDAIIRNGVKAEGMIPVFPTKTFPNHYSIVTGLYTENTGLIANNMFDEEMNAFFSLGNRAAVQNAAWYGGEPIWVTAEQQGKRAGIMFWPGSEAPIKDTFATHWKVYDHGMDYDARVDTVISWLTKKDSTRADFVALYFDAVDSYGHRYGVGSDSLEYSVELVDAKLGYLIQELDRTGIWPNVDIIITSDHGMANADTSRVILLDQLINMDDVMLTDWSPVAMIRSKEGKHESVYKALKEKELNYTVFKKEDLPDRFHMKNNPRVPDIVVMADLGYSITTSSQLQERGIPKGVHGYDNSLPDMQAIFYAFGPSFRQGITIPSFSNVHVYELLCSLLKLTPAPNDGSPDTLRGILR